MKQIKSSILTVALGGCFLFNSAVYGQDADDLTMFFDDSEMVEVESRYPKPLSQVTEQVTVFTAEDIARSHVHTIGQFLAEVPGLLISFSSPDLGQGDSYHSLGSRNYHTLVLVDGVRQNIGSNGRALIEGLAPTLVKKIEIIKGPASSVWGSSLGGVINIITKDIGDSTVPEGMVSATYGEGPAQAVNGEVRGKFSRLGYYFNVDHLDSDGLYKDRYSRKESFYGKLKLGFAHDINLGLAVSDSFIRYKSLEWESGDLIGYLRNHTSFGSLTVDAPLLAGFHLHGALNRFLMDFTSEGNTFITNEKNFDQYWSEAATEGSVRISWAGKNNSAVLGAEIRRGKMDYFYDWWPSDSRVESETAREEQSGVYTNASLNFTDFTLSPGIRFDDNSNSGEAVSPSLGMVYRLSEKSNLRATVARGFSAPYLWLLSNPFDGNPSMEQEVIWNYQVGVETTYWGTHLSATVFHHQIKDAWNYELIDNTGRVRRYGAELEIETLPWHDFSLKSAFSVASSDGDNYENEEAYGANLSLLYDNSQLCLIKINGRYVWWNKFMVGSDPGTYDNFVWDILLDKMITKQDHLSVELFMGVHNLFNASQSWDIDYENPSRWVEAGLTFRF